MDLDSFLDDVADDLGFPVTDDDLVDRYGDTEIDVDGEGDDDGFTGKLEEIFGADETTEQYETEPQGSDPATPDSDRSKTYESREAVQAHVYSFKG